MDVYIFGYHYTFDTFWDFLFTSREWLYTLPVIYQILVLVGIIALTVGLFSLVFYIVKAVFQLVFEIIRILVKFIRSLFVPRKHHRPYHYKYDHPRKLSKPSRRYTRPPAPQAPTTPPTPPQRPAVPTPPTPPQRPTPQTHSILAPQSIIERPVATSVVAQQSSRNRVIKYSQLLHCPNCGGTFTKEMMRILYESESVYCEFCGNKLEYELQ